MNRLIVATSLGFVLSLIGCAPPTLRDLSVAEQRRLGEAAVAKVCGFALDVESTVTFEHEYNLALARQYLDDIVPQDLAEGQLSQFFTLETIGACAANLEWGGVNYDVQRLVERLGTDAEVRSLLTNSPSMDRECRFNGQPESEAFAPACRALGFVE
jgi:hypothetical protein